MLSEDIGIANTTFKAPSPCDPIFQSYLAELLAPIDFLHCDGACSTASSVVDAQGLQRNMLDWRHQAFDGLSFAVGKLSLLLPLASLDCVLPLAGLGVLSQQSPVYLGIMQHGGKALRVVDTLRLIMPGRYDPAVVRHYTHVLVVSAGVRVSEPWALAVTHIADNVRIEPTQVRWQSETATRRWLAGIVTDQRLSALLDVRELDNLLTKC